MSKKPSTKDRQPAKPDKKNAADPGNAKAPEAKKPGRATKRTPEIIDEIMRRISDGEPLRQICRDEHMPSWGAVYDWLEVDTDLASRFARAREKGEEAIAQECLKIADTPQIGEETTVKPNGDVEIKSSDMLGHRKLQIDTRLKLLAKWNPKKWGEKVDLNHGGQENNPIKATTKVVIVPPKATAEVQVKPLKDGG